MRAHSHRRSATHARAMTDVRSKQPNCDKPLNNSGPAPTLCMCPLQHLNPHVSPFLSHLLVVSSLRLPAATRMPQAHGCFHPPSLAATIQLLSAPCAVLCRRHLLCGQPVRGSVQLHVPVSGLGRRSTALGEPAGLAGGLEAAGGAAQDQAGRPGPWLWQGRPWSAATAEGVRRLNRLEGTRDGRRDRCPPR